MADKERCPSPEHIDHQVISVHDPSTAPRRQLTRAVTASLKLSLVLENKGNVARDHLASERTYLTYVQTSLACASAGIVLVQLFTLSATRDVGAVNLNNLARPLGAFIVLFGLVILVFGFVRYFRTQAALLRGYFPVAQGSITVVAFVLVSLVGVMFGVIVAGMQS